MAQVSHQLPLNADGVCMVCKVKPPEEATLTCGSCATPWHVFCLSDLPETMFECPDCSGVGMSGVPAPVDVEKGDLLARIREIEADASLSEKEKAMRRQKVLSGKMEVEEERKGKGKVGEEKDEDGIDILSVLGESFMCSYCMELPERPVTTPCGHNFCLKCFEKWINQGKQTCAKCRSVIPRKMAIQPHINPTLVAAIRMAKMSRSVMTGGPQVAYRYIHDQDRPDKAFTTERAKKAGMANAASGRIFVTLPKDHFGPIAAEHVPEMNQGVLVGDTWDLRMECRQWGVHYPPIAGIAGKANYGAQSIVVSGGYQDDEDHGEWLIYTGSGGRDLSGNKRTNKEQSSDQNFKAENQALRVSCQKGYPVRLVRSEKDKRSPYAPEKGYRYDGIYRVEKCWRNTGKQGFKVCRYLLVRCDNEPAPWTSDEHGDRPRKMPVIAELKQAIDLFERTEIPSWDYDEEECSWKWEKPPPLTEAKVVNVDADDMQGARKVVRKSQATSMKQKLLKGFCCLLCKKVMNLPLTTPCSHNFCKPCLEAAFAGQTFEKERICHNGRRLRSQKNIFKCPACPTDLSEFLQNPQVNRELMEVIEKLQSQLDKDESNDTGPATEATDSQNENNDTTRKRENSSSNLSPDNQNEDHCKKSKLEDDNDLEITTPLENPSSNNTVLPECSAQVAFPKDETMVTSEESQEAIIHGNENGSPSSPLHLHSVPSSSCP